MWGAAAVGGHSLRTTWALTPLAQPTPPLRYLVPDGGPEPSLVDQPLRAFVREVGARSAAPGGGSVAAASAALVSAARGGGRRPRGPARARVSRLPPAQGAALASMAGLMTYGRRQFEHLDATVRRLVPPFHAAAAALTKLVDADARAFRAYLVRARGRPPERGHGGAGGGRPPGSRGGTRSRSYRAPRRRRPSLGLGGAALAGLGSRRRRCGHRQSEARGSWEAPRHARLPKEGGWGASGFGRGSGGVRWQSVEGG